MTKHLTFPLQVTPTGSLQTAEQDSARDVESCVTAILSYRQGWRTDRPDFGRPTHLNFQQGGADPQAIADALIDLEPRATGDIVASAISALGRQDVTINPTGRR